MRRQHDQVDVVLGCVAGHGLGDVAAGNDLALDI